MPSVPARIEPLGPAPRRLVPPAPTWEQFVGSLNPVRELDAGERPREWGIEEDTGIGTADQAADATASVRATLEDLQLRAMRAFVEKLRKRRYASNEPSSETIRDAGVRENGCRPAGAEDESLPSREDAAEDAADVARPAPRGRGRYVPAAVRRAVAARDGHRCSYVDASGTRCSETQRLEFHHLVPFAVSPSHEVSNLTLRCQAHNALAAEQDFGRELMAERSRATRHDSFSKQGP